MDGACVSRPVEEESSLTPKISRALDFANGLRTANRQTRLQTERFLTQGVPFATHLAKDVPSTEERGKAVARNP